jgi:hypothetical protein
MHGLWYRVRSSSEVGRRLLSNLDFLADAFGAPARDPALPATAAILALAR